MWALDEWGYHLTVTQKKKKKNKVIISSIRNIERALPRARKIMCHKTDIET